MPLVTPTPIPEYPPAPQPTDDRVSFSTKSFALVSVYEPRRVSFNLAATETYTNAAYAHDRATAASSSANSAATSASAANQSRIDADKAAQDVRDVAAAIQAGPVASVNGRAGIVAGLQEALVQRTSAAADNGVPLVAGSEYALSAASAYTRALPAGVAGNQIVLNSTGGWQSSLFTLGRANVAHTINGVADDVRFDTSDARRIILSCVAPGVWLLAVS